MNKEQFLKAIVNVLKEAGRWVVLALIPVVLTYLETISAEWAGILIVILRVLDKFIHELGKETENENLITGLTRF